MAQMDYKGTGKIHSFRGLLADGGQDKIRIQGPVGAIAWRIIKFQIMGETPYEVANAEHIMKIYKEEQSSVTNTINFTDNALLGVSILNSASAGYTNPSTPVIIFDIEIFNQDIYITHIETTSSVSCNYYIELEEVKVSKASMAQLAVAAARRDTSLA